MQQQTIDGFLDERVKKDKGNLFAIFSGGLSLTIHDFDNFTSHVVSNLYYHNNIAKGSNVILFIRHGPEAIASIMACWKLGAIITPVDYFISSNTLKNIISTIHPVLAIFGPEEKDSAALKRMLRKEKIKCMNVRYSSVNFGGTKNHNIDDIKEEHSAEDLALCMFTSGSTGTPKGVLHTHASLISGAKNIIESARLTKKDRAMCVLPFSHLNGLVTTFVAPLISDGSVVFLQDDFVPIKVVELIDSYACTWLSAVPTHYALMISPPLSKVDFSLESLRFCRSASAPLPVNIIQEFEHHYNIPIIETMGTTESAGQIFSNPMPPYEHKPGTVGYPSAGIEVRIIGENGCVIRQHDVVGELQVRGSCLMKGYCNDFESTANAFDGAWFKTNDLVKFDEEGYYSIVGRIKDIAIYCGLNISLRAIEDRIHIANIVFDVACVPKKHPVFGETISIYVIPKINENNFEEIGKQIFSYAVMEVPNYQAISDVCFVKLFPRSSVGKIIKRQLDDCEIIFKYQRVVPSDPASLLAMVLGISSDDIEDDLCMGAIPQWDSLAYVALVVAIESLFNRRLNGCELAAVRTYKGIKTLLSGGRITDTEKLRNTKATNEIITRLKDMGLGSYSINYVILGYAYCLELGAFDVEYLLDSILDCTSSNNTLIMNAFSWDFCRKGIYHWQTTPCEMGLINELFRKREDVVLSKHPIYTYTAWGKLKYDFVEHNCMTCWGDGSVSKRLAQRQDVRVITLGLPPLYGTLLRANPVLHVLEEIVKPSHRYYKTFSGKANFGHGWENIKTDMFVKNMGSRRISYWKPLGKILESRGLVFKDNKRLMYSYMNNDVFNCGLEILSENRDAFMVRVDTLSDNERKMGPDLSDAITRLSLQHTNF